MSDEAASTEAPKRGRPKRTEGVTTPKPKVLKQGHRHLRGSQRLHTQKAIKDLADQGMSLAEIESTLKLAKGVTIRDLYGDRNRRLLKQIIEEATIDSILIMAEGIEVVKMEVVQMKTRSAAGTLNLSPEQLGTMVRSMEKAVDLVKLLSGRSVTMFKDVVAEKKNSALNMAAQRLKELEAQGHVLEE